MAITKDKKLSATILSTAIMFLIVGGWMLTADFLDYLEGSRSLNWLPVEGTIKTQSVRLLNRDGGVNHFSLNATYVYHVDGQAYRGDRVAYPNQLLFISNQSEKSAEKTDKVEAEKSMFVRYAPEAAVTVFYNPANKNQCTLTRGVNFERCIGQWLSHLFLVALALLMVTWQIRKNKKQTAQST